jgi:hypothetical protein
MPGNNVSKVLIKQSSDLSHFVDDRRKRIERGQIEG